MSREENPGPAVCSINAELNLSFAFVNASFTQFSCCFVNLIIYTAEDFAFSYNEENRNILNDRNTGSCDNYGTNVLKFPMFRTDIGMISMSQHNRKKQYYDNP